LQLSVTDEHGNNGTATMPYEYQEAKTPQEDNICWQLTKAGGTIYNVANLDITTDVGNPLIPSSHLASLRRQCLEAVKGANTVRSWESEVNSSMINGQWSMVNGPHSSLPLELMHCRYCLRHELGFCTKSGRKPAWREPLSLHLSDGKSFTLKFDCRQCEMYIMR
jgi:putative protease